MATEGTTVLGKSITVRGEIIGSEDLTIDGLVDGTITLTESRLTVGPNAKVIGDLMVHDAIILGHCEGATTATGRVELRKGGTLLGDLTAARLSIEDGAAFRGKVSLTGSKE
ncbi:MAG: bactofilin family protein [Janthinobacterium lividum]